MADPIPFKPGVVPAMDEERELLDYFMGKVSAFRKETGNPPVAVAIVLIGDRQSDNTLTTVAHSWSPKDKCTRFETCSMASVLLAKRASEA